MLFRSLTFSPFLQLFRTLRNFLLDLGNYSDYKRVITAEVLNMDYTEALKESRKAADVYYLAVADYRSGKVGDDEYLKARAAYEQSEVAFDAAYAAARQGVRPL